MHSGLVSNIPLRGAYHSCIVIISYILSLIYISVLCTVYDQDVAGGVLKNVTR